MSIGTVFDIQRFSIHDGPGIRTTVFLKGCPLRCAWCQNPEGLEQQIRVWNFDNLCVGCGRCTQACLSAAVVLDAGGKPRIDHDRCTRCGHCVEACNRNALTLDGYEIEAGELARQLQRDSVFFATSGGGVTFSGGEPLAQANFVTDVAARLKEGGVSTAVETCLDVAWEAVEQVMPVLDYFQVDIKLADTIRHANATGHGNERILANFRRLAESLDDHRSRLRIRVPLVPGFTADRENITAIARLVASVDASIPVELMNFNPLAAAKYRRMPDRPYDFVETRAYSDEEMEAFRNMLVGVAVIR
ncbi:MAG: glycyl-radical enzyme activating protein [Planctomycetaceae bacterium]|nr:glycyl-radical enzyme activating protein [Planctomycetaceae bacterium]